MAAEPAGALTVGGLGIFAIFRAIMTTTPITSSIMNPIMALQQETAESHQCATTPSCRAAAIEIHSFILVPSYMAEHPILARLEVEANVQNSSAERQ